MSKEKTTDEIREEFLGHIRMLSRYWDNVDERSTQEKLDGLAFSILSAIDGCSMSLPSFILAPRPHEEDKEYHIENGEDYYPENHEVIIRSNISGGLHELYYKKEEEE